MESAHHSKERSFARGCATTCRAEQNWWFYGLLRQGIRPRMQCWPAGPLLMATRENERASKNSPHQAMPVDKIPLGTDGTRISETQDRIL